jgi:glyoxylase-like metal-dependent hydrolase (beta-lactamase superfamily II)
MVQAEMRFNRREGMVRPTRSRQLLVGSLAILILTGALAVGYRLQRTSQENTRNASSAHTLDPYALTVVPGIYLLGGLAPAAAYVVETSEGLVLIDSGLDKDAGALRGQMVSLKLDWRRIRAILLTHVHGDHTGGAEYLRTATRAKVYAGKGDAAPLRAGGPREAFFSTYPMPESIKPTPTTVDVELNGDEVIRVGDVSFQALVTPGHTPGSVCYLMERGDQRVLFSGDIIWSLTHKEKPQSIYSRPFGTYAAYLAPRYRGDARAFLATLRRLWSLPAPQLVLPGHPRNDRVPANPAMTQERWEALLDPGIREMERIVRRYTKDGANFLDGGPKQLLPDLYYLGDREGIAVYGLFTSGKFFVVNAPGSTALGEFLQQQLRQLGHKPALPTAVLLTSGDPEVMSGLPSLLAHSTCQVVAPRAVWAAIQSTCPTGTSLISTEDLPGKGWFPVEPIPQRGRGVAPVSYLIRWGEKSVLCSGRIPIKATQAAWQELSRDFVVGKANVPDYRRSLARLQDLSPDLWLPAVPCEGQNANLYEGDWKEIVGDNLQLVH